jgi:tRNA U34 2-thiouridine synthase MnmA/TrmU
LQEPAQAVEAQYRYRGPRIPGHLIVNQFIATTALVEIPTPGQSIVFYTGETLVGGGIITA